MSNNNSPPSKIYPDLFNSSNIPSTSSGSRNSASSLGMSIAYVTRVLDIISEKKLRDTMLGVAKQTGYTAAGAVSGGLMFGPPGALVGSVIGAVVGYQMSEDYDNIITVLRGMSDEDKARLGTKVQGLVGAVSIEEFVRWIQNEGHRALLLGVLSEFARQAASKANVSY